MRITLRQLQIFISIAKCGSTTAAGEEIALSQSAISASIAELEKIVNTQLFDRVGRRLQLNDHGRAMMPHALALVDRAENLEKLYASDNAPSTLIVGASLTIGNYLLPRLLSAYWRQQGLSLSDALPPLQIAVANTADIIHKVANFEVDIGLVEGACHHPNITVKPWLKDELLLVASSDHPLVRQYDNRIIPTEQLADANWLLREPGSGTREALEQALSPDISHMRSTLEFSDHEAIKHSAAEGLGIACLSRLVVSDMLTSGKLAQLNTKFSGLHRRFSLLLHHQKQVTPGMQHFIEHALRENRPS
ncbi:LysR family transcriptional regulator [Methylophilus sp. 3sh_L]|uniref:LysR family transcriptional regulator n=1 Tax=Methylophilus sp. 3sh_L TaxID=3377114 RepID=UPI00398E4B8E